MLAEALVLYGCSLGQCTAVMNNYELYNPEVRVALTRFERSAERFARKHATPYLMNVGVPLLSWAVRQELDINLHKNTTLKFKAKESLQIGLLHSF